MKKGVSFLAVFLMTIAVMQSCEIIFSGQNKPKEIELRKKSAEIIEADQQFAFELFQEICSQSEEENIMISPLSVSYALGMAYNGASGTTLDAFNDVLHLNNLSRQEVNESYQDLMNQLIRLDKKIEMSIANSIWYREGFFVLDSFIRVNEEYFDAAVKELDFMDPTSVDVINNWIEDKTNNKIRDMLDYIPKDAFMYLINAVYFNATWKLEFDRKDTYEGDFYLDDGTVHRTDFMQRKAVYAYAATPDFTAVELPYGDSTFSMVVMLPVEDETISDLEEKIDLSTWNDFFLHASPMDVMVDLPKFKYDFKSLLNDPLKNLGLGVAFGRDADFSDITGQPELFITRVIHQTFIDVMEKGTEAAASTIVELGKFSIDIPLRFKADKPFIYIIKENSTGAILFMGKVGKPEYE